MYPEYEKHLPYLKISVDNFVFYIVNIDSKCVEIHRILHSSRDITRVV
jgi:plasmid stabilization system protein ParE